MFPPCNAMYAQDCKCSIFDLNFPRVSSSVALFTTYTSQALLTPRFDRLLIMISINVVQMPHRGIGLAVVVFRYARSDHTIQLPPSLYYECRFQLDAGLFKPDPRRDCDTYTLGSRSWDRRSHVDKSPTSTTIGSY